MDREEKHTKSRGRPRDKHTGREARMQADRQADQHAVDSFIAVCGWESTLVQVAGWPFLSEHFNEEKKSSFVVWIDVLLQVCQHVCTAWTAHASPLVCLSLFQVFVRCFAVARSIVSMSDSLCVIFCYRKNVSASRNCSAWC